ncbi:MAG: hypothetical protein NC115_12960, partial [Bacteroidales bacterium]|nr:hypothetical protein [Bacteroidales bacterium]
SINYRYCHETAPDCPQWLKSAVSDIASTVTVDGRTYLTSLRTVQYDTWSKETNPYPLSMTDWSSAVPSIVSGSSGMFSVPAGYEGRTGNFVYNSKFRLIGAYYPLGAYVKYVWDSDMRHIVSKETDSPENVSRYSWKDLVGVTRIEYPTTGFNLFDYDSRGRLSEQRDLDGSLMYRYMYHLENE